MSHELPSPPPLKEVAVVTKISWAQYFTQHPIANWTNDEIDTWLESVGLAHLAPVFVRFNGLTLLTLTDRLIDELFSHSNPAIKALDKEYKLADKVNFKFHFDSLLSRAPVVFKLYTFITTFPSLLTARTQTELVNKVASETVSWILKSTALGVAAVMTVIAADAWQEPKKSKKSKSDN